MMYSFQVLLSVLCHLSVKCYHDAQHFLYIMHNGIMYMMCMMYTFSGFAISAVPPVG